MKASYLNGTIKRYDCLLVLLLCQSESNES